MEARALPQLSIARTPSVLTDAVPVRGYRLNALRKATPAQIDAAALDFEAQFISQVMENMFSTIDSKEALGGSDAEETYHSFLLSEYGKIIARTGGLGISDQIKRDMLKHQEVEQPNA